MTAWLRPQPLTARQMVQQGTETRQPDTALLHPHVGPVFASLNRSLSPCSAVFFVTYLILACCSGPR